MPGDLCTRGARSTTVLWWSGYCGRAGKGRCKRVPVTGDECLGDNTPDGRLVNRDELLARWSRMEWEAIARENPLFAVMSVPDFLNEGPDGFSEASLEAFFRKGEDIFETHVRPCLARLEAGAERPFLVEYGCGMGRILKAVLASGYDCAGIDISPTMLKHCRNFLGDRVPLYQLDADNRCGIPDGAADIVYSYAVFQHIQKLSVYERALEEVARIVAPGGVLALHLNCEDFIAGDFGNPGRTENFEDHSVHYRAGATVPFRTRQNSNWSGVKIGYDRLRAKLDASGIRVEQVYYHRVKKPRGIWVIGHRTKA